MDLPEPPNRELTTARPIEQVAAAVAPLSIRVVPTVVRVVPPPVSMRSPWLVGIMIFAIAAIPADGLISVFILTNGTPWSLQDRHLATGLAVAAGMLVLSFVIAFLHARLRRRVIRRRREVFGDDPKPADDPVSTALCAEWTDSQAPPEMRDILAVLKTNDPRADRAWLVCAGSFDVPPVDEYRFPLVVTSTHSLGGIRGIWATTIAVAAAGSAILATDVNVILPKGQLVFGCLSIYLTLVLALMLWRSLVSPTYLRLAPGVIEFLRFGALGMRPRINSYPMLNGTVVYLRTIDTLRYSLFVQAGRRSDRCDFRIGGADPLFERILEAALSTAPTPPMDQGELVG